MSAIFPRRIRVIFLRLIGCKIHPSSIIAEGVFIGSNKLYCDINVAINIGCFLDGSSMIKLEENVRIGPYVRILTGTHEYANNVFRRGSGSVDIKKPVIIERGCWIGMGATILPGITLREGCVIAANATVIESTLPNGLYAGTPAQRIKNLSVGDD
jgi:maltose O-acetyltransferase